MTLRDIPIGVPFYDRTDGETCLCTFIKTSDTPRYRRGDKRPRLPVTQRSDCGQRAHGWYHAFVADSEVEPVSQLLLEIAVE